MKNKNARVEELMSYVKLLKDLLHSGFQCQKEMQEALEELHKLMSNDNKEKVRILIVKENGNEVDKTFGMYKSIISYHTFQRHNIHDISLYNDDVKIEIIKRRENGGYEDLRGGIYDYVINDTDDKTVYNYVKIKVKKNY